MPDPGAILTVSEQFLIDADRLSIELRPLQVGFPIDLLDLAEPLNGAHTENRPLSIRSLAKTGAILTSYFEDYYNRIYVLPAKVDFGAITGVQTQDFIVWNAFLHTSTVDSVVLEDTEGLTLDGPATPTVFKPLAYESYTLTVTAEGPPVLDAIINFDIGTPIIYHLPVVGIRAFVTPFIPNWREPVEVTYEFKTEVIKSRSGKEQRSANRHSPRKTMEFSSLARQAVLRRINQIMAVGQAQVIVMPEWTRRAVIPDGIAGGNPEAIVETLPNWIFPTAKVMLYQGGRLESRTVLEVDVDVNLVTFTSASVDPWLPGVVIHPALSGTFATDMASTRPTNRAGEVSVVFDVLPASEPDLDPSAEFETWNGRELFMKKPNWGETPSVNYQHEWDRVDYDRGVIARYIPIAFGTKLYRATFVGKTGEEAHAIREFFERAKGQRGEFYMPTWENDLPPKIVSPAATNAIRVDGTEVYNAYHEDTVHKALVVLFRDGSHVFNVVTNITQVSDGLGRDSVVSCLTAWPVDIDPANVLNVSWLPVWRHASDSLTIQWLTSEVAQIQLTVQTLEDLPV